MVDYGLKNKVAIITGANNPQGIGATTAFAFAREGAKVVLVYKKINRPFDMNKTHKNGVDRYYQANAGNADIVEKQLMEMMADFHRRKEQSNIDLVENLNRAGYAIDYAAIKASTADGFVNRAVIAAALLEKGYVESIQGAFKTLLKPSHGYYNPPKRPDAFEVIRYIRSIGAAAVLAHPFLNLEEGELREFLPQAKAAGLHGMEVLYSKFDAATTALAEAMAEEFSLLKSGGSDFHGTNKPDIAVGIGRGDLRIPAEWLKNLKMVVENFEKQVDICGNI